MEKILYFDNAATTFPKPAEVISEVTSVMRYRCGNPGRSSHKIALAASDAIYECREKLAGMFGGSPEKLIFTQNATHALNMGIKTVLHRGDHVLISDIEHNSVIRPVAALAQRGLITYDVYTACEDSGQQLRELMSKLRPETSMICACHHSNICNFLLPIREIGAFCLRKGIVFLVDASQSAGTIPISMEKDNIDLLCAPGHKGLYGPPGTGFIIYGNRFDDPENLPDTFTEGGNGIRSTESKMPDFLPERLEAGTLAVPAIAGLAKGADFVRTFPQNRLYQQECDLYQRMRTNLKTFDRIRLYGEKSGSILLFSVSGCDSEVFASALNEYGICVRAGLHCSPLAHRKLGTPSDGAIRVSFGAFNTEREVNEFCSVTEKLLKQM